MSEQNPPVNDPTPPPSSEPDDSIWDEVKSTIAGLRQDFQKELKARDGVIGELKQVNERLTNELDGVKKSFEKARSRPQQTLVPPPPPPPAETDQPVPPQNPAPAPRKRGWRGIW